MVQLQHLHEIRQYMSFKPGIQKGTDKCKSLHDQKYETQNTSLNNLKTYIQTDKKHSYPRDLDILLTVHLSIIYFSLFPT